MKKAYQSMEHYLNLPWSYSIDYWEDQDGYYVVSVKELAGCKTHGSTVEEALTHIREAIESYLLGVMEDGEEIPEPLKAEEFKGVITYRTTPEKHYRLAKESQISGKSLNRLIDEAVDQNLSA